MQDRNAPRMDPQTPTEPASAPLMGPEGTPAPGRKPPSVFRPAHPVDQPRQWPYEGWVGRALDPMKSVMVIGSASQSDAMIRDWFTAHGIHVYVYESLDHALAVLASRPQRWAYVFVNVDPLGPVDRLIGRLGALRRRVPQVAVVLLSQAFHSDDFGAERLAVADISLRLPLTLPALEVAVEDAPRNSLLWQRRCGIDAPPRRIGLAS